MYLNNCKDGMHGPLEVFSRGALMSFAKAAETCGKKFDGGEQCTKAWEPLGATCRPVARTATSSGILPTGRSATAHAPPGGERTSGATNACSSSRTRLGAPET